MARSVVALGNKDAVIHAALQGLVQRNRRAHELLFDAAEPVETWLQLEVVVAVAFGDGGDDGDVVALGADVVRGGDDGDVDVCRDEHCFKSWKER